MRTRSGAVRGLRLVLALIVFAGGCTTAGRGATRSDVIRQILPATVQLRCERDGGDRRAASGVILARDTAAGRTWIVTTRHFLEPLAPQKVSVSFSGRKARATARVVSVSERADLALLEVDGAESSPVRLKDSVTLGDEVWVVAYPWGRRMTLSSGVVSQIVRDDGDTDAHYEGPARMVDVSVSYGASGGGVFDAPTGALIGLVESYRTARMSVKGPPERVIEIPVPGETTLISADIIRRFIVEAGLAAFLED
ncbi:MAG TPA: serine protease [Methylomirabilota bacterium]|nr:serine protease [Methylomirabilota bacterium]